MHRELDCRLKIIIQERQKEQEIVEFILKKHIRQQFPSTWICIAMLTRDRISSSECCFYIGRRLISWGSQRQLSIALSEMEAHYTKARWREICLQIYRS